MDDIHDMTFLAAVASGVAVRTAVGSVIRLMDRLTHCVGEGTTRHKHKCLGGCPRAGLRAARAVRALRVLYRVSTLVGEW